MTAANSYNASSIDILEGLEAVRLRPGMYIGGVGVNGLTHLCVELINNSVDEAIAGFCNNIDIVIYKNGSFSVQDNGRGVPVDVHPKAQVSAERVIFTILHAGGKFGGEGYKISGGLHGVGASVVNALSSWLEVHIQRDGHLYMDRYENGGNPVIGLDKGQLKPIGISKKTGTKVQFMPDPTIFPDTNFRWETILQKVRELSFLTPGVKFNLKDERNGKEITFHNQDGLKSFVEFLLGEKKPLHEIICFTGETNGIICDIALVYNPGYDESIFSFTNNINTPSGGTHETGFKKGLTRIINISSREKGLLKAKEENFRGEDVREGLLAVISLKHPNPQFEGQTKAKLGNPEVEGIVNDIISSNLELFFDKNQEVLKTITDKAIQALKSREASKKAKDLVRNKESKTRATVIDKLASCSSKDPKQRELFIVEGDSAGGSAKQGRNRHFQAILPLRGKTLNVEKQELNKLLNNTEIKALIQTIGTGIGDDFNLDNLNYHKIIIATDADVDGAHIRTLLMTFFFRYMKDLITGGHIYVAQPPLYKITYKNKVFYAYNDKELKDILAREKGKPALQRYKGLGEMNARQLWDTTMDPEKRVLKQINISDSVDADIITTILMGSEVPPRRQFIENNHFRATIDL